MANQDERKRRWLPAFSIRTLLIAMTLLCGYVACWWPTKTQGVKDVHWRRLVAATLNQTLGEPMPIAPLIVAMDDWKWRETSSSDTGVDRRQAEVFRNYYFWFFGYVAKLPYERKIPKTVYLPGGARPLLPGTSGPRERPAETP